MKFTLSVLFGLILTFSFSTMAHADEEITIERVIGQEFPGSYKHPCTITQLDNEDLYITYYGGAGEYQGDTAVFGMRKVKGSDHWNKPIIIADTPNRSEGNGCVWQAPDGKVWLFYITNYGPTWSHARIKCKISEDGAHTWSDPYMLSFEQGTMLRSAPIVLNNGDYLLPVYHETGADREQTANDTCSFFLRYDNNKKTWTETNRIYSEIGNLQAQPVQIDDNYLVTYIRRGGSFDPLPLSEGGCLYRSESRDGGYTWSPGKRTQFKNPNSACDFIKLQSGNLLLVFNDNDQGSRMPLTAAISTDNDKTYPHRRVVLNNPGDSSGYPVAIQAKDGKIHVVYTSNRRMVINHLTFEESAILNHKQ